MTKHFLCYSPSDAATFALRLRDGLEAGPPPIPVWYDTRDIQPGQDWVQAIDRAIKTCRSFLFVITRDSVQETSACNRELESAFRYNKPIVLLKLHPDAGPPLRLAARQSIDFTGSFESPEKFSASLASLRKHLTKLDSSADELRELKEKLAAARQDLIRAKNATRKESAQAEIFRLGFEIAALEEPGVQWLPELKLDKGNKASEPERQPETPTAADSRPGSSIFDSLPHLDLKRVVAEATQAKASRVFICYRRADSSGHAGRLYDRLCDRFSQEQVFMDIDAIEPGVNFVRVIDEAIGSCGVVLALIGRHWLDIKDAAGRRRLDSPKDFVRLEIATALKKGVRLIPVLVQGASMPDPDKLPEDMAGLADLSAFELSDTRWKYDADRLVTTVEKIVR